MADNTIGLVNEYFGTVNERQKNSVLVKVLCYTDGYSLLLMNSVSDIEFTVI